MLITFYYITLGIVLIAIILIILFLFSVSIKHPKPDDFSSVNLTREKKSDNSYQCGKSWLRKNRNNLWEMYIEGEPFERGVKTGKLTKELLEWQEKVFLDEIRRMVPNRFYLFFLKNVVLWLNRKLKNHISEEYNLEIYGTSLSTSEIFNSINAPAPFKRLLNYHAAHDIGHALQDMKYVGCTSFSVWGEYSANGNIITARNFDFYINDDFSKEKILAFINPSKGLKFAMVTWAGMAGAVSGMNEKGVAITINAAKSAFQFKLGTPISILIREMLQYASNIKEVIEIAKKRNIFVSELIMVSSASDKKTVIIEKTPFKTELFESTENKIICTNHCQSKDLKSDKENIKYMEESSSVYRYERVQELININSPLNPKKSVEMLQNKEGKEGKKIGNGNEKALNQLLAHHGIIFQPEEKILYLSSPPYNMGEYMAYDLKEIFANAEKGCPLSEIDQKNLTINKDGFTESGELDKYLEYKKLIVQLNKLNLSTDVENNIFNKLSEINPDYYLTYSTVGNYLLKNKRYKEAIEWFNISLQKEVSDLKEENKIKASIEVCQSKMQLN